MNYAKMGILSVLLLIILGSMPIQAPFYNRSTETRFWHGFVIPDYAMIDVQHRSLNMTLGVLVGGNQNYSHLMANIIGVDLYVSLNTKMLIALIAAGYFGHKWYKKTHLPKKNNDQTGQQA